jgi:hypothetical protein
MTTNFFCNKQKNDHSLKGSQYFWQRKLISRIPNQYQRIHHDVHFHMVYILYT